MVALITMIIRLYWLVVMSGREKIEKILGKAKEREKDSVLNEKIPSLSTRFPLV